MDQPLRQVIATPSSKARADMLSATIKLADRLLPVLCFMGLLLVWEIALQIFQVPSDILPSPSPF